MSAVTELLLRKAFVVASTTVDRTFMEHLYSEADGMSALRRSFADDLWIQRGLGVEEHLVQNPLIKRLPYDSIPDSFAVVRPEQYILPIWVASFSAALLSPPSCCAVVLQSNLLRWMRKKRLEGLKSIESHAYIP